MSHSTPIPHDATVDDPLWSARFHELANALILSGAKGKIVSWATGLTPKQVSNRYVKLCGKFPPLGRTGQGNPVSFARPTSHRGGHAWTLQCAIFTGCYDRLKECMNGPVHKAWLLYTAHETYIRLTEDAAIRGEPIPINVAYDIVSHTQGKQPTLKLHPCPDCEIRYLVLTSAELDHQDCPVCAIQKNCDHLIKTGTLAARKSL